MGLVFFRKILRAKKLGKNEITAFNDLVPLARMLDKITFNKTGLSIIVTGIKKGH